MFSPKKSTKTVSLLTPNKVKLCKNLIITLIFEETPIFSPKIAENCHHNIDPRTWSEAKACLRILAFKEIKKLKGFNDVSEF
jgi:hypothetical protein